VKQGDLVTWKEGGTSEAWGASTYLLLNPDLARSELAGEPTWIALSYRGNFVVVHEDSMRVVGEAECK
jgi:hypothetical protein